MLAFRRLYQAKWKATKVRPDTKQIRQILEKQITGFDVSESALQLAALSLYLTAIELDPEPVPPSKLRFKALRGRVLFNWRREGVDPANGPVIGSLGDHVGPEHRGAYQVVLCNPPWTSLPGGENKEEKACLKQLATDFTTLSHNVLERRELPELAKRYKNPDRVPDLPFIWRSLEWCETNGRIGLVLPGRILFKQETLPCFAREALFRAVAITGIINCSNLTDTNVWPGMQQPFMLLFAQNRRPKSNHALRFVTPYCDVTLNGRGEIRIDSKSIEPVVIEGAFKNHEPWRCCSDKLPGWGSDKLPRRLTTRGVARRERRPEIEPVSPARRGSWPAVFRGGAAGGWRQGRRSSRGRAAVGGGRQGGGPSCGRLRRRRGRRRRSRSGV